MATPRSYGKPLERHLESKLHSEKYKRSIQVIDAEQMSVEMNGFFTGITDQLSKKIGRGLARTEQICHKPKIEFNLTNSW